MFKKVVEKISSILANAIYDKKQRSYVIYGIILTSFSLYAKQILLALVFFVILTMAALSREREIKEEYDEMKKDEIEEIEKEISSLKSEKDIYQKYKKDGKLNIEENIKYEKLKSDLSKLEKKRAEM